MQHFSIKKQLKSMKRKHSCTHDGSSPSPHEEERYGDFLKDIIKQNHEAIECFERGETSNALRMFQVLFHQWSSRNCADGGNTTNTIITLAVGIISNFPTPRTYSFSNLGYDEGLDCYAAPEEILVTSCHPDLVSAILLFNTGTADRKCTGGRFSASASKYYQSSLDLLLPLAYETLRPQEGDAAVAGNSSLDLVRILIPALHCVASAEYYTGGAGGLNKDTAMTLYKVALEQGRRFEGQEALSVAASLNCLGVMLLGSDQTFDREQAAYHLEESARLYTKLMGSECPQVATVLNNLGRVLLKLGDANRSLACFTRASIIRRHKLGPNHIDYGAALFNSAQTLCHLLHRHEEALPLYLEFLRIAELAFTENHRYVLAGLNSLACIYQWTGQSAMATEYCKRSVHIARTVLQKKEPLEFANVLHRIGTIHFESERYPKALEIYEEELDVEQEHLEKNHPFVTRTLSNIAECYRRMGNLSRSIEFYREALIMLRARHGQESAQVAAALNVVGLVQQEKGDLYEAIQTLQEALVVRRAALGESHLDVSATLMYLGTSFCRIGMHHNAMLAFQEAFRISSAIVGNGNSCSVSTSACAMFNAGACQLALGHTSMAMSSFRAALEIQKQSPSCRPKDIASTMTKLGRLLGDEGLVDDAAIYLEHSLQIHQQDVVAVGSSRSRSSSSGDNKIKDLLAELKRALYCVLAIYQAMRRIDKMMHAFVTTARTVHRICGPDLVEQTTSILLEDYGFLCISCAAAA